MMMTKMCDAGGIRRGIMGGIMRTTVLKGARGSTSGARRSLPANTPDLKGFMARQRQEMPKRLRDDIMAGGGHARQRTFFLETYGCQMNEADSQVVDAVLDSGGMVRVDDASEADVVLMNTCAVREKAEEKIWLRLRELRAKRQKGNRSQLVGVLGCMAERLKDELLDQETLVNFIAGPDAYRDLPRLIDASATGLQAMNVQLSLEETYADIIPVRPNVEGVSAWLSIMRGCNNMCSFCVVPFTRGRERSRALEGIVEEVKDLAEQGVKEITLLGQNVNSYWDKAWEGGARGTGYSTAAGFNNLYKLRGGGGARFVDLLEAVSDAAPNTRIRFTSPHPKDFPPEVLELIAGRRNLCKSLHMPAQSGSSAVLQRMRRGYTREAYLDLIGQARALMPGLAVTTDMISGFCGESEEEHAESVSLMTEVGFDQAFMFAYSERSKTHAHHTMPDDVPEEVKLRRLQQVIDAFRAAAASRSAVYQGTEQTVLVEGMSKRSTKDQPQMSGRSDANKVCVWQPADVPGPSGSMVSPKVGDYLRVKVNKAGAGTLYVEPLEVQAGL